MHIFEENIKNLDLNIPDMPTPLANYVPYKVSDSTVYVSGQGPVIDGKILYSGKVGVDISEEEGIKAAEICCINIIAALKTSINGVVVSIPPASCEAKISHNSVTLACGA